MDDYTMNHLAAWCIEQFKGDEAFAVMSKIQDFLVLNFSSGEVVEWLSRHTWWEVYNMATRSI